MAAAPGGRHVATDIPQDLPALWVDSVMLDQVLTNVLENAAKYVDGDAEIRVLARLIEGQPMLRVTVEDAGMACRMTRSRSYSKSSICVSNGRGSGRVSARDGTGAGCCSRPGGGNGRST